MSMLASFTGGTRWRAALAGLGIGLAVAFASDVSAHAAEPARAIDPGSVRGCCLCRGTAGEEQTSLRTCSDGHSPTQCVAACKEINADSIIFGYQQTCSQGCAGYPTQGLQ